MSNQTRITALLLVAVAANFVNKMPLPFRRISYPVPGLAALLAVVLVGLMLDAGCVSGTESDGSPASTGGHGLGSTPDYYGPATLEERIAGADAIVRARLVSVTAVAEQYAGETDYIAALDLRFRVLEYLRGSGASELVAVVYDSDEYFSSRGDAIARANALKNRRDTQWDGREAILFLNDDLSELSSGTQANRYWLGAVSFHEPYQDYYTIASQWGKDWLPAASAGGASGTSSGTQRFLLNAPPQASGGASGQSATSTPTITLAGMKAKIAANDGEIAAGGGSEAYKDCLYLKHKWARKVKYTVDRAGVFPFYIRHDSAIDSGLPAGTRTFREPYRYVDVAEGETAPASAGDFPIMGRDAELFRTKWPGVVDTVRPLPAGEYKFYFSYRPREYVICDGEPEEEKKREEVFVAVTAPAGTLHEAFFDPVAIGAAVGADASNGVLKPAAFGVPNTGTTTIASIEWESQQVDIEVSPYALPANHHVDFISLDGTVALRLDVDDATETISGSQRTFSWRVCKQPWVSGDKLMLRLSASPSNLTGAAKDPSCAAATPP